MCVNNRCANHACRNVDLLYVHSEHHEGSCTKQRSFKLEHKKSYRWSVTKQVRDDIQKQAKLKYVAGAHMAKVQWVKDWMAEVKKKVIRGVPRSREYGRYFQQMQVVWNKRNDG